MLHGYTSDCRVRFLPQKGLQQKKVWYITYKHKKLSVYLKKTDITACTSTYPYIAEKDGNNIYIYTSCKQKMHFGVQLVLGVTLPIVTWHVNDVIKN